jgi:hypothetical protein
MHMKEAIDIFAQIQMILARRLAGDLNDSQVVVEITKVMDTPDVMAISLGLLDDDDRLPDGEDRHR